MEITPIPQNPLVVVVGSAPRSDCADAALRRHLAQTRLAEAMRLMEQAQTLLDRAARNLCPIIGAAPKHRKTCALVDRVRALWYELERGERSGKYELDGAAETLLERGEVER